MLIHALHAALEHREESFNGVGVDEAILFRDVFASTMSDKLMIAKVIFQFGVLHRFISHDSRFACNVRLKNREQSCGFQVINDDAARLPAVTVDQRKHFVFVMIAAHLAFVLAALFHVVADEGFIDFDSAAIGTERSELAIAHRFTNSMAHEPSRFKGDSKSAVQLIRADTFFAGRDQEDRLQPEPHRDVTRLKNGANFDGKRLAAVIALVHANAGAFASKFLVAFNTAAMWAYSATRPNTGFYEDVSGLLIVELGLGKNGFARVNSPTMEEL